MIHFDIPKQKSSIIKVLGVGGGGSNAVNYMFGEDIEGVDFIICNTDAKALEQSKIPNKIQLGPHLTQGLGAGANPEVGKQATEESLEEIKRILEVNTRMAFICAGMGGGTGTGGAPIIAKICRELGILTVGIVTTPFPFEGPRRIAQAEAGIKQLEPYVDTLLVISNDKLRMQYGNLKMREAFGKADNVLATAAKCITDIINSRGHIIVDFADVCTVMKNGGVAILGSAAVGGEDRAQRAIEEALNSPLLNDNDISGAKWILININSAEGDNECTMDELETINNHLRTQAGEFSDVIVGMGYDNSLDDKIGITLIATGFEQKDPFAKSSQKASQQPKHEKLLMTLSTDNEAPKPPVVPAKEENPLMPKLSEPMEETKLSVAVAEHKIIVQLEEEKKVLKFDFIEETQPTQKPQIVAELPEHLRMEYREKPATQQPEQPAYQPAAQPVFVPQTNSSFLNKPMNVYAEAKQPQNGAQPGFQPQQQPPFYAQPPVQPMQLNTQSDQQLPQVQPPKPAMPFSSDTEEDVHLELVIKPNTATPVLPQPVPSDCSVESNEEMEKKAKAQQRVAKLRNLSFNMNNTEVNSEFDNVPAYVRRNMELYGNNINAGAENYYSKITVKKDNGKDGNLSTINTFLDGKKPD